MSEWSAAVSAKFDTATDEELNAAARVGKCAADIDDLLLRARVAEVSPLLCAFYYQLHRMVGADLDALTAAGWNPSPSEVSSMVIMLLESRSAPPRPESA